MQRLQDQRENLQLRLTDVQLYSATLISTAKEAETRLTDVRIAGNASRQFFLSELTTANENYCKDMQEEEAKRLKIEVEIQSEKKRRMTLDADLMSEIVKCRKLEKEMLSEKTRCQELEANFKLRSLQLHLEEWRRKNLEAHLVAEKTKYSKLEEKRESEQARRMELETDLKTTRSKMCEVGRRYTASGSKVFITRRRHSVRKSEACETGRRI
ncbi:hypothetical protein R1flu_013228 [Riccia fluitans]|uniref:Uncharacterized protein n=1 Tax=Riccia fluitans TaxID=41844 RepID=A0ABD1YFT8_9MARC